MVLSSISHVTSLDPLTICRPNVFKTVEGKV